MSYQKITCWVNRQVQPWMESLSQSSQGTNRTDDYFTAGSQDFSFLEFPNTQDDDASYLSGFTGATQAASQLSHQFDETSEHSQNISVTDLASQVDGLMNFDETFDEDGKEHACV